MVAASTLVGGIQAADLAGVLGLAAVAAVVTAAVFGVAVRRALHPDRGRPGTTGTVLGSLGVVTILAFWSGLPVVFGGAAVLLGVQARARGKEGAATPRLPGLAAIALGVVAVAGGAAAVAADAIDGLRAIEAVQVEALEYGYAMPWQVAGGVVGFELTNSGEELHEFALVRLEDNRTAADLAAAFDGEEGGSEPDWMVDVAGVPALSPGQTLTLIRALDWSSKPA